MKKWIAMLCALCLALGLGACNKAAPEEAAASADTAAPQVQAAGLQVGFGKVSLMPESPVPMAGYTDTTSRMSTGFRDVLYATCLAFTEGEQTVLVFSQDLFKAEESWVNEARANIARETGVPENQIVVCATHNHAGPDTSSGHSSLQPYRVLYQKAMVEAAKAALNDRAPATLYSADTKTENLNFPRHYRLSDGSYGGDVFGDFTKNSILGYEGEGDPTMLLVKADREGEKQDILIVNWQVYPCVLGVSADTNLSADFIGLMRGKIEQETGMLCAYFNGAAGNLKPQSRIAEDKHKLEDTAYSEAVAQVAIDALPSLQKLEGKGVSISTSKFTYEVNHEDEDKITEAREVVELAKSSEDAAGVRAKELGLLSVFHARQIVNRVTRPQTAAMELDAVKVGGMAFVTAPYEMFCESGIYIRENSPFAATVICSCANAYYGNFATEKAYEYQSYESYTNYFAKGCAEAAAQELVSLLKN